MPQTEDARDVYAEKPGYYGPRSIRHKDISIQGATEAAPHNMVYIPKLDDITSIMFKSSGPAKMRVRVSTESQATLSSDEWTPLFVDDDENEIIYDSTTSYKRFARYSDGYIQMRIDMWPDPAADITASVIVGNRRRS